MKLFMFEVIQIPVLFQKIKNLSLPVKTAYILNKILSEVEKETQFYYEELRKISEKFGEFDTEGQPVFNDEEKKMRKIKESEIENAQKALTDLSTIEVSFQDNLKISLSDLDKVNLSIEELRPLIPFIEE